MWKCTLLAVSIIVAVPGCDTGRNYSAIGPRYSGSPTPIIRRALDVPDTLSIVSFNIAYARNIAAAIHLFSEERALRYADVVLLQEMDARGARRIADVLGMFYAYYPITLNGGTNRDFGNAVLSRWPIIDDAKILLPHRARLKGTRRSATAATIVIGSDSLRVYSVHLGTLLDVGPESRRNQLRAVLADAANYKRVIIGGDMNNFAVGQVARDQGYNWVTEKGPRTILFWRWDHIFTRGFDMPEKSATGAVSNNRGASDHRPVWARLLFNTQQMTARRPQSKF